MKCGAQPNANIASHFRFLVQQTIGTNNPQVKIKELTRHIMHNIQSAAAALGAVNENNEFCNGPR
jgi:hypothetical protein